MKEKNRFRVKAGRLILTFCCFAAAVTGCVALMDMLAREPSLTVVESPPAVIMSEVKGQNDYIW